MPIFRWGPLIIPWEEVQCFPCLSKVDRVHQDTSILVSLSCDKAFPDPLTKLRRWEFVLENRCFWASKTANPFVCMLSFPAHSPHRIYHNPCTSPYQIHWSWARHRTCASSFLGNLCVPWSSQDFSLFSGETQVSMFSRFFMSITALPFRILLVQNQQVLLVRLAIVKCLWIACDLQMLLRIWDLLRPNPFSSWLTSSSLSGISCTSSSEGAVRKVLFSLFIEFAYQQLISLPNIAVPYDLSV